MDAVLFVFFLFAFLLLAAPHIVAITATGLILASLIVRVTARRLTGAKVRLSVAFRTLIMAFLLSMLAVFAATNAVSSTPAGFSQTLSSPAANLLSLGAYALGFRVGLGLSWQHAALVAAICSLVIGLCIALAVTLPTTMAALH